MKSKNLTHRTCGGRCEVELANSRGVCDHCGLINYVNPKVIAGVVGVWQDKILMCRRAIEPRNNFWTLPAMEQGETLEQNAGLCRYCPPL